MTSPQLANELIQRATNPLTAAKLHQLVTITHGWHLALYPDQQPLVEEDLLALPEGPRYADLSEALKPFGRKSLSQPIPGVPLPKLSPQQQELIKEIISHYEDWSLQDLNEMTHAKGTPWNIIAEQWKDHQQANRTIPQGIIQTFFHNLVEMIEHHHHHRHKGAPPQDHSILDDTDSPLVTLPLAILGFTVIIPGILIHLLSLTKPYKTLQKREP